MRILLSFLALALAWPVEAREAVDASAPEKLSVTVYRNPDRGEGEEMDRDWPQGFAMISEVRTVTLPAGESTIRFTGVSEGMVAVSAIVTGLPGGTIEKNRNADLLSPAALVDGTLGNRVTITRTNPATGKAQSEDAIVRTRADGGLVLQTAQGFEAVRCSGLPESLTFNRVPVGLSAQPVFTIDTRSPAGGTYQVTLTYISWGFDWEANYVARLREGMGEGKLKVDLLSWLTLLNDNDQSFDNAELMAVAGKLNIGSDFQALADPPQARALSLTCYPFGSTAAGSPIYGFPPPPPPPPPPAAVAYADSAEIVVTGARIMQKALESPSPVSVVAAEEVLGDLKLYRVPERVDVSAKGQKQVAFLDRKGVKGKFLYITDCDRGGNDGFHPAAMQLLALNEKKDGLGQSLPMGGMTIYEPTEMGDLLVAETRLRDYALSQEVELDLPESSQVQVSCGAVGEWKEGRKSYPMRATVANANDEPITMRLKLGWAADVEVQGMKGSRVKDGFRIVEVKVPANSRRTYDFRLRETGSD
ncbi:DUF4139 domain-containing protein [Qipengyuania sp. RANM35]|uniref:DUF4139 domain-containing protein n=1 Tax=Qipengyuania sp. RANM35 TaxID=3068635 RepID=UPI0034DB1683